MPSTSRQRLSAHLLLIAAVLVWGVTFPLVKSALSHITPLLFNLLRMAIASAILLAINATTLRHLSRPQLKLGALAGLMLAAGYQFQTAGLAHTTPSKSAFITGLVVVFVPLLAAIPGIAPANTPRPGPSAYLGALLAFTGLVLLTTPPGSSRALLSGLGLGEILTLLCALAFAGHLLTLARAAHHLNARQLGALQVTFATLFMLLTLPLEAHPHALFTPTVLIALAVTAVLATAAAFTIQSYAQQHIPASHTALIVTLEPVFAWLTSLLFFHEHLGPRALTGAALILAGILLAELAPNFLRPNPPTANPLYP
ncbi:MAG: DMT family transporter [Acidobacteriota bacterium]